MTEMTLEKAVANMKFGDKCHRIGEDDYFILDDNENIMYAHDGKRTFDFDREDILACDYEIIPAEPKVLSEFQILKKIREMFGTTLDDPVLQYANAISKKNGRLERDLEYKEVFQTAIDNFGVLTTEHFVNFILEAVKPLNP